MKARRFNDYQLAGGVLIAAAVILLGITVLGSRGDMTAAATILAGTSCFIAGVFVLTLTKGEPVEPGAVSLLPVPGTLAVARMCADLGVQGDACFLPRGDEVIEMIPVADIIPEEIPENGTYVTGSRGNGVLLPPAGALLLSYLGSSFGLRVPASSPALESSVAEVLTDVLEVADRVGTAREGDAVIVTISGYRLIAGCRKVQKESPKCCSLHPCPVCSLVACMFAKGTGRPVTVTRVMVEPQGKQVKIFLKIPEPGGPAGEEPGNIGV